MSSFNNASDVNSQVGSQHVDGNVNHYHGPFYQYRNGQGMPDSNTDRSLENESPNKYFEVPHLLSPVFTGRVEICQSLDTALVLSPAPRRTVQRRFILHGLGGSGKTQICLRYVHTYREKHVRRFRDLAIANPRRRYWGIFWIDASTISSIQKSFAQIGRLFRLGEDVDQVKQALTNTTQPWLMVFDNADDPDLSLSEYFPTGERGDVIITSRNPGCRSYETVGYCEVGSMQDGDSLTLLLRIIHGNTDVSEKDKKNGRDIVTALGHLALAVTQAGAYIRETSCTPSHYLELYHRRRQELLRYGSRHNGTDYRYTVFTTWQVSLDRIASMQDATSVFALHILRLVCFYHHDRVPLSMFERTWQKSRKGRTAVADWDMWPQTVSDAFDLRDLVYKSTALLASYSLVSRDLDASFSLTLHPLVYDWCQVRLDEQERRFSCKQAILLMATSATWKGSVEDYAYRRSLMPHVQACLRAYYATCGELDNDGGTYHWGILASALAENGFRQDAVHLTELVVKANKSELGEEHSRTIKSMHSLANRYSEVGRRNEALQLSERVVQIYKSKLGPEHPDTIRSMHNLAIDYSDAGRRDEALQLAEQVAELYKSKFGPEHPDTIRSMHNLAMRYNKAGRREEALELTEQVVKLRKSKLGTEHPDTIKSMHNLAIRYSEAKRLDEALKLTEQVVQLRQNKLGIDHPDTMRSMYTLVMRYKEVGRRSEALELSRDVIQLRKNKLGDDHPETIESIRLEASLSNANTATRSVRPEVSPASLSNRHSPSMSTSTTLDTADFSTEKRTIDSRSGLLRFWQKLRS